MLIPKVLHQESVQCAIEELDGSETELQVHTFSKELVLWLAK